MDLPPFLVPFGQSRESSPLQGVFNHPLGPTHALWWNSGAESPEAVFLFIPGNPGLLNFYTEFLSSLHSKHPSLAVFGHAHLAHTPGIHVSGENGLRAQVQSAIEALDAVRAAFGKTKIVLGGHSVGAWIALQVLKARPSDVFQVFLLCPTVTHIADTPNGRQLQIAVLRSLLNSPSTIFACLSMAHDEMVNIRELDNPLLNEHMHRIYIYFAETDGWVSKHKAGIMRCFLGSEARVVEGQAPHAFCLNHGEDVARECSIWLNALNL